MSFYESIGMGWLLVMYFIGFGLLLIELLVPGLIAGTIGMILVMFAVVGMIILQPFVGILLMILTVGLTIFLIRVAVRRFSLKESLSREEGFSSARAELAELMGQEGRSLTPLRPSGTAEFGSERVDVVTGGEMIAKDSRVKVIEVEGNRIVVRALDVSE